MDTPQRFRLSVDLCSVTFEQSHWCQGDTFSHPRSMPLESAPKLRVSPASELSRGYIDAVRRLLFFATLTSMTQDHRGKKKAKGEPSPIILVSSLPADNDGNDDNNEIPSSQSAQDCDMTELNNNNNNIARLNEIECKCQCSTTDPFLNTLQARRDRNTSAPVHVNRSAPTTHSAQSVVGGNCTQLSRQYCKMDPSGHWPFYVVFTGPGAGIYDVW